MNLKEYLFFTDTSAVELAKKAGVKPTIIYNLCNGKNVRFHDVAKVIKATNDVVTIYDLLPNPKENKPQTIEEIEQHITKARWESKFI